MKRNKAKQKMLEDIFDEAGTAQIKIQKLVSWFKKVRTDEQSPGKRELEKINQEISELKQLVKSIFLQTIIYEEKLGRKSVRATYSRHAIKNELILLFREADIFSLTHKNKQLLKAIYGLSPEKQK